MVQNSVMLEKGVDNLSTFWRLNELFVLLNQKAWVVCKLLRFARLRVGMGCIWLQINLFSAAQRMHGYFLLRAGSTLMFFFTWEAAGFF